MAGVKPARRFCWRERTEKLNWRMLKALDVADVVRRGDPALLEPYALHLTFARLPAGVATRTGDPADRDAWFIVRVFQLSMEYLLFMRSRDSDVLDSLGQELRLCESERDELTTRARKWKARSRSGEKQVEKLHQVLQNIAKLLQIHGASPSAVSTIETLLTELITERRARQRKRAGVKDENTDANEEEEPLRPQVQEARVCPYCGKLFSSTDYLEKHLARRHSGESRELKPPPERQSQRVAHDNEASTNKASTAERMASEQAMQNMVQQMQKALHAHEESLRSLAKEETRKIERVYEQLHVETQLAEELKVSRLQSEKQHEEKQHQLDAVCQLKQDATEELADLKEQIQFLTLKKKMMGSASTLPSATTLGPSDANSIAEAEVKRLYETLEMVNTELASARDELAKLQSTHLKVLREKQELAEALALARDDTDITATFPTVKLETSSQTEPCVVAEGITQTEQWVMIEGSSQTERCVVVEKAAQADAEESQPLGRSESETGNVNTTGPLVFEEAGTQTSEDDEIQVDTKLLPLPASGSSGTSSVAASSHTSASKPYTPVEAPSLTEPDENRGESEIRIEKTLVDERIPDCIQKFYSDDVLDAVTTRAEREANEALCDKTLLSGSVSRGFSSLSRRKFVLSRFQHDESTVRERVSTCLQQLGRTSQRYGVSAKTAWLSNDNLQIVQQALHGHLEVLPTEVLGKMVDCENAVNAMIAKEWVPREKARQQALERFKVETHAKSQASQELVKQAMAAFGVASQPPQPSSGVSDGEGLKGVNGVASSAADSQENTAGESNNPVLVVEGSGEEKPLGAATDRRYSDSSRLTVIIEELPENKIADNENWEEKMQVPQQAGKPDMEIAPAASHQSMFDMEIRDEPSPVRSFEVSPGGISLTEHTTSEHDINDGMDEGIAETTTLNQALPAQEYLHDIQVVSVGPHLTTARPRSSESFDDPDPLEVYELGATPESLADVSNRSLHRVVAVGQRENTTVDADAKEGVAEDTQPSSQEVDQTQDATNGATRDLVEEASNHQGSSEDKLFRPGQELEENTDHGAAAESEPQQVVSTTIASEASERDDYPAMSSPVNSLESDRLSAIGELADISAGVNRSVSLLASSEMSFDANIPSLGTESVGGAAEASDSTIAMGLNDFEDGKMDEVLSFSPERVPTADSQEEQSAQRSSPHGQVFATPGSASRVCTTTANENLYATTMDSNSVMSLDDSDIEEVVLT